MAKIYISYSTKDREIALELTHFLQDLGHEALIDTQELMPGIDWRKKISDALKSADGIITLITENSLNSQFVMTEIGTARTYSEIDKNKFFIPVIFDNIKIPIVLQDIQCLFADRNHLNETAQKIHKALLAHSIRQKAEQDIQAKQIAKIETNASKYVDEAMTRLKVRESSNKIIGNIWYILGFICLFIGVVFGVMGISEFLSVEKITANVQWTIVVILTLKTTVIIGLLIACSKYSFTLGKSYINEALKNADRIHAISFGKFYLDAYGSTAKWEDLKEAFQYWNINNESTFSKLDTNQYDPKFVELVVELSKIISGKTDKK